MKFPSVVGDAMKEIISVEESAFVYEAAQRMIENKIGSIAVTENGKPVGIITRSDMIKKVIVAYIDPRVSKAGELMSHPIITIDADTLILDAMRCLRDKNINQVFVERDGEIVGIISEGDMIRVVIRSSLTQFSSLLRKH
jgi:CBS domain-containing protein